MYMCHAGVTKNSGSVLESSKYMTKPSHPIKTIDKTTRIEDEHRNVDHDLTENRNQMATELEGGS